MMSTPLAQSDDIQKYTFEDYMSWPENAHIELVDGVPYRYGEVVTDVQKALTMHATPTLNHQIISANLVAQFILFLKGKPCRVFHAPVTFKLHDASVFEPDIIIACDLEDLSGKHYDGIPEIVVEILSPSTRGYDKTVKYNKYFAHGVKEYWLVDPTNRSVDIGNKEDSINTYAVRYYVDNSEQIKSQTLQGFEIGFDDIFGNML